MDNNNNNNNNNSSGSVVKIPDSAVAMPLSAIAEAFEDLVKRLKESAKNGTTQRQHLRLDVFCDACSLVSVLFNCLGFAFKFAELEYVAKVLFFSFFPPALLLSS